MEPLPIQRRLGRRRPAFGIRVTAAKARRLGGPRTPVEAELRPTARPDPSKLHLLLIGRDASERHDEVARRAARVGR